MLYPTSEADIVAKQIKRLRKTHQIGDIDLAIIMDVKKADIKKQPSEVVLEAIETEIEERRLANANKAPRATIHEALGIEPVAFEIEVNGRRVRYQSAFQKSFARGDETLQIGTTIITGTKRISADRLKKHIMIAITGNWTPGMPAADIDAILTDFGAAIRTISKQAI
ncbi:hypothetical protein L3V16_21045 [Brucella ciceri]|uniref:hypothetical protein n=1 Tax=Brucella ciceri TaxID=391287 RepID=UPI000DE20BAC|nr:hypothetical protein [Brucella ciceri]MCH6206314.1 hypothetical protein [Brucella ciceri]